MSISKKIAAKSIADSNINYIDECLQELESDMLPYLTKESNEAAKNRINAIRDELASLRAYANQIG